MRFYFVRTRKSRYPDWWPKPVPKRLQVYRHPKRDKGWWTFVETEWLSTVRLLLLDKYSQKTGHVVDERVKIGTSMNTMDKFGWQFVREK